MSQCSGRIRFAFALILVTAICSVSGKAQVPDQVQAISGPAEPTASNAPQRMIVFLRHQPSAARKGTPADAQRAAEIDGEQQPLLDEVRTANSTNIKSFHLANAFAATMLPSEIEKLKANPLVDRVIGDRVIKKKRQVSELSDALTKVHPAKTAAARGSKTAPAVLNTVNYIPGACGANGAVQLAPEGIVLTNTDSQVGGAQTARSLGLTGAGVKVAWMADGIDINNVNFIRPQDGLSVFDPSIGGDYQDFSGDGPNAPTNGGEAFLDSNSIAGQGVQVYDVSTTTQEPNSTPCNVTIEGVAPGAALVGLKVYSTGYTTYSGILEGIDYAVETDHVDVINQSFGSNNFPDDGSLNALRQFDDAAVAAGVVVVASSGDAGSGDTIGSPATDPLVISVGASTQFQMYAQSNWWGAAYFATGWLSNNISSISSGGFDQAGGTIDLVAPGDQSWMSCDNDPSEYYGCYTFTGASDVVQAGGTSESSPFVAGAAALVIQAYRQTHNGASPTPALVKQILVGSAGDLGGVAVEQGAGLLNSYQAALLAESVSTSDGSPAPVGNTLLLSTNQLNGVGLPNTGKRFSVVVTNTGATQQTLTFTGRTLGPDQSVQTGSVTVTDSSQFTDVAGYLINYGTFQFTVPSGASRLYASIAQPSLTASAWVLLIDPQGRLAGNSYPSGNTNYGTADVTAPVAGTWTGVIAGYGLNATVSWQAAVEQFQSFGTIAPASATLAPGASKTISIQETTPASAGDLAGSIVISSNLGETTTIPVTLRSLINVSAGSEGTFSGVLTGGNGRYPIDGQAEYYQFLVGSGVGNMTVNLTLGSDPNYYVGLYLIGPDGNALGFSSNFFPLALSETAYTLSPSAGMWTLALLNQFTDGTLVSQPFSGSVIFNNVNVTASGLPNSASTYLPAGVPVTVPVTVTNNGAGPGNFFADARHDATLAQALPNQELLSTIALPIQSAPEWIVPTETDNITVVQTSTLPAMFDMEPYAGDPLLATASFGASAFCSNSAALSYSPSRRKVTPGYWIVEPAECGPFSGPASSGSATISFIATLKPFDRSITSNSGDYWYEALNPSGGSSFTPVTIGSGQTGTIYVTITPGGRSGQVVKGTLYIDDYFAFLSPYGLPDADEVAGLPYEYTIQ